MKQFLNKIEDYKAHNHKKIRSVLDAVEFMAVLVSFVISINLAKEFFVPDLRIDIYEYSFFGLFVLISWYVLSRVTAMAKLPRTQRYLDLVFQFIRMNFIILVALLFIKVVFRLTSIPLVLIFTYVTLSLAATLIIRIIAFHSLKVYRANGYNLHHVIIIADSFSDPVIEKLLQQKDWGFNVKGIITESKLIVAKYSDQIKIYPHISELKELVDNTVVDEVLYSRKNISEHEIKRLVKICDEIGVIFRLQSSVSPLDPFEIQLKTVKKSTYLTLVDVPSNNISMILKAVGDFYFSITAVIFLLPLFLIIAIMIKLDSKGPVFFSQERVGLRGRKFKLYKFRTMVTDAEKLLAGLKNRNEMDGPTFKIKDDPRITPLGRFLRKTGLDELPQLYNVVRGEMSLIGPRPPLESEVKSYERWQLRRLSVKPGITCTWQIIPNRNDVKFEKWMKMDLNYIDNWSLTRDIRLFFETMLTFFNAGGR
ncbi:MAG TPA: sugar transferase [Bacteroidales bacterium]|nr:sugar transferase [Bacteroidales bacterium]